MKNSSRGFSIIENLVVTGMGAIFMLLFIHGTILVVDRFFSVQSVTDFDEDRKILRAQVLTWSVSVFNREVYLSNEFLKAMGAESSDSGENVLPYTGSFGSGFALENHVVQDGQFVSKTDSGNVDGYDIVFLFVRSPKESSLTAADDSSSELQFPGNPGLYRFNLKSPYLYVDADPTGYQVGDYVALSSVGGTGFGRISSISGRRIEFNFAGLGEYRPEESTLAEDPSSKVGNVNSPFSIFYKGGMVAAFDLVFVGVSQDDPENPRVVIGKMTPNSDKKFEINHSLNLPVEGLRLVRGNLTTIPGGTFIPFDTPQQLAASVVAPSFLNTRLSGKDGIKLFDQRITFLVPL